MSSHRPGKSTILTNQVWAQKRRIGGLIAFSQGPIHDASIRSDFTFQDHRDEQQEACADRSVYPPSPERHAACLAGPLQHLAVRVSEGEQQCLRQQSQGGLQHSPASSQGVPGTLQGMAGVAEQKGFYSLTNVTLPNIAWKLFPYPHPQRLQESKQTLSPTKLK